MPNLYYFMEKMQALILKGVDKEIFTPFLLKGIMIQLSQIVKKDSKI